MIAEKNVSVLILSAHTSFIKTSLQRTNRHFPHWEDYTALWMKSFSFRRHGCKTFAKHRRHQTTASTFGFVKGLYPLCPLPYGFPRALCLFVPSYPWKMTEIPPRTEAKLSNVGPSFILRIVAYGQKHFQWNLQNNAVLRSATLMKVLHAGGTVVAKHVSDVWWMYLPDRQVP